MPYYARRDGSHRRLFLGESRRGYLPSRRDESRADPDRVRSVLSAGGLRIGKAKAITATARTLAVLVYRTLKDHLVYVDHGADAYDAHDRTRVVRRLTHRAAHLGFGLVNLSTGKVVEGAVSWGALVACSTWADVALISRAPTPSVKSGRDDVPPRF